MEVTQVIHITNNLKNKIYEYINTELNNENPYLSSEQIIVDLPKILFTI